MVVDGKGWKYAWNFFKTLNGGIENVKYHQLSHIASIFNGHMPFGGE